MTNVTEHIFQGRVKQQRDLLSYKVLLTSLSYLQTIQLTSWKSKNHLYLIEHIFSYIHFYTTFIWQLFLDFHSAPRPSTREHFVNAQQSLLAEGHLCIFGGTSDTKQARHLFKMHVLALCVDFVWVLSTYRNGDFITSCRVGRCVTVQNVQGHRVKKKKKQKKKALCAFNGLTRIYSRRLLLHATPTQPSIFLSSPLSEEPASPSQPFGYKPTQVPL